MRVLFSVVVVASLSLSLSLSLAACVDDSSTTRDLAGADLAGLDQSAIDDLAVADDLIGSDLTGADLAVDDLTTDDLVVGDLVGDDLLGDFATAPGMDLAVVDGVLIDQLPPPPDGGVTAPSFFLVESGLDGASLLDVAVTSADKVFAISAHDIFRSVDQGAHWTRFAPPAVGELTYTHISASPLSQTVYVTTSDNRLFVETAGGDTFTAVSLLGGPTSFASITTTHDSLFVITGNGTIMRLNTGTWENMPAPPSSGAASTIVESGTSVVYLGSSKGIYTLLSGPFSWSPVTSSSSASSLVTDGSPNQIASYQVAGSLRYFDGTSWTSHGTPPSPGTNVYTLLLTASDKIFGFRSTQIEYWLIGSASVWTKVLSTIAGPVRTAVRLASHVYVATDAGLLYSSDYANYFPKLTGLRGVSVTGFTGHPTNASIVFASTKSGIYRSTDGGVTFARSTGNPTNGEVRGLVISRADPNTMYAMSGDTIIKSSNGGGFGTLGLPDDGPVTAIAVSHGNANYALACIGGQLRRSIDGGGSFPVPTSINIANSGCEAVVYNPTVSMLGYAMVGGSLVMSNDVGDTFTKVTTIAIPADFIHNLKFRETTGSPLYLVGEIGVYRWDGAMLKTLFSSIGSGVKDFAVDPFNDQIMYIATSSVGLLLSTDGGDHWAPSNLGLPARPVVAVTVHPADRRLRFVAPDASGVYRSDGTYTP